MERLDREEYLLQRRSLSVNEGAVQWLLDCPAEDWFVPIESESTGVTSKKRECASLIAAPEGATGSEAARKSRASESSSAIGCSSMVRSLR